MNLFQMLIKFLSRFLTVLDEADRILDMGFSNSINAIITSLPTSRQTLLFSATQTKSVKDLARLSLHGDPEYVAARETGVERDLTTPKGLEQSYMVIELQSKMDYLWTFLKTHLKTKIIVFLSSCKQVCVARPSYLTIAWHTSSELFWSCILHRFDLFTKHSGTCGLGYR